MMHLPELRPDIASAASTVRVDTGDVFDAPAPLGELTAPTAEIVGDEVPVGSFTEREWAIFRQGQRWGYESRQSEVDALQNAFQGANDDADRYYRAAFDHDYHDCAIHENKGRYKGARTRLLHWEYWGEPDDLDAGLEHTHTQQPST